MNDFTKYNLNKQDKHKQTNRIDYIYLCSPNTNNKEKHVKYTNKIYNYMK